LRHAHHVPEARNRVAEGVQTALGVAGGRGCGGKDHARSADGGRDRTRLQDAHAHRARALIARSGNDRRTSGEACQSGSLLADVRANFR